MGLLEGLMMYLAIAEQYRVMAAIGQLSAPGSVVFHDAISATYVEQRISIRGATFVGGSDDYLGDWARYGGFQSVNRNAVRSIDQVQVDRVGKKLVLSTPDNERMKRKCKGNNVVLFVEVWKE